MKSIAPALMASKAQHLAFLGACVLLVGGGLYAKVAIDDFGAQQDEFCERLSRPSPVCLWLDAKREKSNSTLPRVTTERRFVPAKPATNGPALP
jgi:hypothetical protein